MGVLCSGTCFGAWPHAARESQHTDSIGGITMQCCDVIKSLSGEGMSEGFTAGGSIPHPETPNPQEMSCKMFFFCFCFSVPWPHFMMLSKFQVHKPFNLALFLLIVLFFFFFAVISEVQEKSFTNVCRVRPHILSVQPVLFFGKSFTSHSGNNYYCKLVS